MAKGDKKVASTSPAKATPAVPALGKIDPPPPDLIAALRENRCAVYVGQVCRKELDTPVGGSYSTS